MRKILLLALALSACSKGTVSATGSSSGATGGTGANRCSEDLTSCGATCVDIRTDGANCGGCGVACATGTSCTGATCTPVCTTPQVACGLSCATLASDGNNCGACGRSCTNAVCTGGACHTTCASGETACGTSCETLDSDVLNCGACGNACPADNVCHAGACLPMKPVITKGFLTQVTRLPTLANGDPPMSLTFQPVSGAVFACAESASGGNAIFAPCDGATGTGATFTEPAFLRAGTHRILIRFTVGSYQSQDLEYDFFLSSDLGTAHRCFNPPITPPTTSYANDTAVFAAATAAFATAGLPLAPFSESLDIVGPNIIIPFTDVVLSKHNPAVGGKHSDVTLALESMRHRFVLNADRTLLAISRGFESGKTSKEKNTHNCGAQMYPYGLHEPSEDPIHPEGTTFFACDTYVVTSKGAGVCLAPTTHAASFTTKYSVLKLARKFTHKCFGTATNDTEGSDLCTKTFVTNYPNDIAE